MAGAAPSRRLRTWLGHPAQAEACPADSELVPGQLCGTAGSEDGSIAAG